MKKKKYLWMAALAFLPSLACAEPVSFTEAKEVGEQFFQSTVLQTVEDPLQNEFKSAEEPAYYIFNCGQEQGFVIVSAESSLSPILAYSLEGSFTAQHLPDNLKHWLTRTKEFVQYKRTMSSATEPAERTRGAVLPQVIVDLNTVNWDQSLPYNAHCPQFGGQHVLTGCAITASAIIMAQYQWPDAGVGTTQAYSGIEPQTRLPYTVPAITLGDPYKWSDMPILDGKEADTTSLAQRNSVGILMRDLGAAYQAIYGLDNTSAYPKDIIQNLPKYMKYQPHILSTSLEYFSKEGWDQLIKEELDQQRPVCFTAFPVVGMGGHAFVIDGYDELGLFSVNWGWGGKANGFFSLDYLRPDFAPGGYDGRETALFRILPDLPEYALEPFDSLVFTHYPLVKYQGLTIKDSVAVEVNQPVTLCSGPIFWVGTQPCDGQLAFAHMNEKAEIQEQFLCDVQDLKDTVLTMLTPFEKEVCLAQPILPGDRIRLLYYAKGENQTYTTVQPREKDVPWEIILKDPLPSAVEEVLSDEAELTGPIYDLSGRMVTEPVEGQIYIQGGKKRVYTTNFEAFVNSCSE